MTHVNNLRRVSTVAALVALLMALASVALGCGQGASAERDRATAAMQPVTAAQPAAAQPATAAQPVTRASTSPTAPPLSLHERIMAEQGRTGASLAGQLGTTASAGTAAPTEPSPPVATATADLPLEAAGTTTTVLTGGQTPLQGVWGGTAEQLTAYLLGECPSPRFTVAVTELAGYYVHYCAEAGLRADLLWAQMILETGYGMYDGDVLPEQNNYAGVGATGGGVPGASFATAEAGVMAQVAHMVAYVYTASPVSWADTTTDPRFDLVDPRGAASVLSDLDGRWAVPGDAYGEHIENIARAINGG